LENVEDGLVTYESIDPNRLSDVSNITTFFNIV